MRLHFSVEPPADALFHGPKEDHSGAHNGLPVGSGVAQPFVLDITAIKDDNGAIIGKGINPKKSISQRIKSAISKAFDTIKIIERSSPLACFPLAPQHRVISGIACAGSGE